MRTTFEPSDRASRAGRKDVAPQLVKAMLSVIVVLAFAVLMALWSQAGGPAGPGGTAMSGPPPKLNSDSSRTLSE